MNLLHPSLALSLTLIFGGGYLLSEESPKSKPADSIELTLSVRMSSGTPDSEGDIDITFSGNKAGVVEAAEPAINPNPEITYSLTTRKAGLTTKISTGEEPVWIDWGDGQKEQVSINADKLELRHNFQNPGEDSHIIITGKDFELYDGRFRKIEVIEPSAEMNAQKDNS